MAFNYYDGLDGVSKSRYDAKLGLINVKECPYKFAASIWENNPTKWPMLNTLICRYSQLSGRYTRLVKHIFIILYFD